VPHFKRYLTCLSVSHALSSPSPRPFTARVHAAGRDNAAIRGTIAPNGRRVRCPSGKLRTPEALSTTAIPRKPAPRAAVSANCSAPAGEWLGERWGGG
jgi:hypothetical protein